ncbi:MAG: hypothetical protein WC505_02020 [Patescibacteria group bacterium]
MCKQTTKPVPLKPVLLDTVSFVLLSIIMICPLFIGIHMKQIPPIPGGIAILCFGATLHGIGLKVAWKQNKTFAAGIIGLFYAFWLYCGFGLLALGFGTIEKEQFDSVFVWCELPLALSILILAFAYCGVKRLFRILLGLMGTVVYLWLSKVLFHGLQSGVPVVVGALMLGSTIVFILQLREHARKLREYEEYERTHISQCTCRQE